MAAENSFDVVSKINMSEVTNAVSQAMKEISQRFDFKGSKSNITQEKDGLVIISDDDYKLKSVVDILHTKMVKRGVPMAREQTPEDIGELAAFLSSEAAHNITGQWIAVDGGITLRQ